MAVLLRRAGCARPMEFDLQKLATVFASIRQALQKAAIPARLSLPHRLPFRCVKGIAPFGDSNGEPILALRKHADARAAHEVSANKKSVMITPLEEESYRCLGKRWRSALPGTRSGFCPPSSGYLSSRVNRHYDQRLMAFMLSVANWRSIPPTRHDVLL